MFTILSWAQEFTGKMKKNFLQLPQNFRILTSAGGLPCGIFLYWRSRAQNNL